MKNTTYTVTGNVNWIVDHDLNETASADEIYGEHTDDLDDNGGLTFQNKDHAIQIAKELFDNFDPNGQECLVEYTVSDYSGKIIKTFPSE